MDLLDLPEVLQRRGLAGLVPRLRRWLPMRLEEIRIRVVRLAHRAESNFVFVLLLLLDQLDEMSLTVALGHILHPAGIRGAPEQIRVFVLDLIGLSRVAPLFLPILRIAPADDRLMLEELIWAQLLRNFLGLVHVKGVLDLLEEYSTGNSLIGVQGKRSLLQRLVVVSVVVARMREDVLVLLDVGRSELAIRILEQFLGIEHDAWF